MIPEEKLRKYGAVCGYCGINWVESLGRMKLSEVEGKKGVFILDCGKKHKDPRPGLFIKEDSSPSGFIEIRGSELI